MQDRGLFVAEVWAVHQGDSERHSGMPKWWFDTKQQADDVAVDRGWYGGTAPVSQHSAIVIGGSCFVLRDTEAKTLNAGPEDEDEIKQKALAKLSATERKVLGITST